MFAERFRSIVDENKISRYKIAKELNVSQSTVANWYFGDNEPKATQIAALCKYFDVSADYLLGITDEY
ncbi:MAG: helix-turn-helix domain-containing protein [Clostridia bacterium]|nr:helix-turn-helix domain-containing protein [Clostridia bacterium]